MTTFLLFSFLSGVLELGTVLRYFNEGYPLWNIFLMASMYQLGNLLFLPERLQPSLARGLGMVNGIVSVVCMYSGNLFPEAFGIVLTSLCIQIVRAEHKENCPTWIKRTFRIGGFLFSPVMVFYGPAVMVIISILAAVLIVTGNDGTVQKRRTKNRTISFVMVYHQIHYFIYTYIMPLTVIYLTKNIYMSVFLYVLTWLVYLLPEWVLKKNARYDAKRIFFICHLLLGVLMAVLSMSFLTENIWAGLCAWMLTGAGGGSVFCIKELTEANAVCNMPLSENIGHFLGSVLSAVIAAAVTDHIGMTLTGVSCIFVCMTLLAAVIGILNEKNREGQPGEKI